DLHLVGEFFSAIAGEQNVLCLFHHEPGQGYRMPHGANCSHASAAQRAAIHDRRVELVRSGGVKYSPATSIEQRIVLEKANYLLDGIQTCATALQHFHANIERLAQRLLHSLRFLRRRLARTAVQCDSESLL